MDRSPDCLKPDPRGFQFALDAFGNPAPDHVVFVDDQRINLSGAEALGLSTVFFDPTEPGGFVRSDRSRPGLI